MNTIKTITAMTTTLTMIFLIIGATFVSCKKSDLMSDNLFDLPEKSAQLIEADNQFGLEMFRKVAAEARPNDNTMVSPLSVALALR